MGTLIKQNHNHLIILGKKNVDIFIQNVALK